MGDTSKFQFSYVWWINFLKIIFSSKIIYFKNKENEISPSCAKISDTWIESSHQSGLE